MTGEYLLPLIMDDYNKSLQHGIKTIDHLCLIERFLNIDKVLEIKIWYFLKKNKSKYLYLGR